MVAPPSSNRTRAQASAIGCAGAVYRPARSAASRSLTRSSTVTIASAAARGDVWVAARPLGSERDVIGIGGRLLGRGRGLVAVAAAGELDVDDGAVVLAASVVGVGLAEAQLAVEDDLTALAQVPGGRLAGLAELRDVEVDGAPAAVVGGDAQRRELGAVLELSELGVARKAAVALDGDHGGAPSCPRFGRGVVDLWRASAPLLSRAVTRRARPLAAD